jgi:hypothetical protein
MYDLNLSLSSNVQLGFENFRQDEGWTQRRGDDAVDKNLYRHPSRQGFNPCDDYEMRHDIYSLGVCLLEIGLWSSFVQYEPGITPRRLSNLLMESPDKQDVTSSDQLSEQAKTTFIALARHRLPGSMGDEYASIVETCLTCLDPGNMDFGDETEFEDNDGIRVGARYIEKVHIFGTCRNLHNHLLDSDPPSSRYTKDVGNNRHDLQRSSLCRWFRSSIRRSTKLYKKDTHCLSIFL